MSADTVSVDRSDFGTFIHSELDDAGLSPFAFRVYCHLARRANVAGKAWPGAMSMSRVCGMSENTIRKAVAELEARVMITVKRSKGGRESNHYHLCGKAKWTPAPRDPLTSCTPPLHVVNPTPSPRADKGIPVRTSNEGNPTLCAGDSEEGYLELFPLPDRPYDDTAEVEAIYAAYPRKVKAGALKAIRASLKRSKLSPAEMLASVEFFAAAVRGAGTAEKFIPLPTTWFNQDRWQDNTPKADDPGSKW